MRSSLTVALLLALSLVAQEGAGWAADGGTPAPVFRPPKRGAPVGRVAAGTRGQILDKPLALSVLTPDQAGLTASAQPTLYWFVSEVPPYPVELTVTEDQAVSPLAEKRIPTPERAGIQRIRLADAGVRLETGKTYRWYVAIVPDAERRSNDVVAYGEVERVELDASLAERVKGADPQALPGLYAAAGLWYEALDEASALVDAAPASAAARGQRTALLEQVGLGEAAKWDRAAAQ